MAKRAQSRYLSGVRSREWLKIKTGKRQEAVIVGFTAPRRTRPYFGALVLAVRDKSDWRYVGRVGTGFPMPCSRSCTASSGPCARPHRRSSGASRRRRPPPGSNPKLVAEVKFTEWTSDGEMRHPAFLGLREDKKPVDVVIEEEQRRPA